VILSGIHHHQILVIWQYNLDKTKLMFIIQINLIPCFHKAVHPQLPEAPNFVPLVFSPAPGPCVFSVSAANLWANKSHACHVGGLVCPSELPFMETIFASPREKTSRILCNWQKFQINALYFKRKKLSHAYIHPSTLSPNVTYVKYERIGKGWKLWEYGDIHVYWYKQGSLLKSFVTHTGHTRKVGKG
jgi:hypothetical protein